MGLVELLVAMTVMAIGIFALVAGFSSGFGAINRASTTSTAGTLADQQMEAFRRGAWGSVVTPSPNPAEKPGADGRSYWLDVVVDLRCPDETVPSGTPGCTLSGGTPSRPVKRATVIVRDGPDTSSAKVLFTSSSTFDQATG